MRNYIIIIVAIITAFLFTACEKADIENIGIISTKTTQPAEQDLLKYIQELQSHYQELTTTQSPLFASAARTNQSTDIDFSIEDTTAGISIFVNDTLFYDIPGCTVTITDNGDFDTYAFTAIDSFEEIDNIATYSFELDFAKSDKTHLSRPFSFVWPQFSAWPVPTLHLFGTWDAVFSGEDDTHVMVEVPLIDPFSLNQITIDIETSQFEFKEYDAFVRITGLKQ